MDSPVTMAIVPAKPICLRCSIEAPSYAQAELIGIHRMVEKSQSALPLLCEHPSKVR
jgi:hypothetical protein